MNFTHYDLGNLGKGRIVEIILQGNAANVQLMDSSNFNNYRNGRQYRYIGGLAKKSPVRLQTTHSGHWHVAIDLRGMRGNVRSSVRVLPEALPEIRQLPLNSVPSLIHNRGLGIDFDVDTTPEYDVFISHASEDKDEVVRPLATALRDKMWLCRAIRECIRHSVMSLLPSLRNYRGLKQETVLMMNCLTQSN